MTISKRNPAPAKAAAARKPAVKTPAAPTVRRAAAASKTPAKPTVSPATLIAATPPATPRNKEKRIRTSFALPESQIALLAELKKHCLGFGVNVKKGELLTAGLQLLKNLPETALEAAVLPLMRSDRQPKVAKKRKN